MQFDDIQHTAEHIKQLERFTRIARDKVYAKHCTFTDTCDDGAEILAKLLSDNGFHGAIVNGTYKTMWGRQGHHWVNVGEYYLDPTREQFGGKKLLSTIYNSTYHAQNTIKTF